MAVINDPPGSPQILNTSVTASDMIQNVKHIYSFGCESELKFVWYVSND